MSTYTKTTNFTAKDNLTSGDPAKVIKGSEFDTEFNAIETAVNSKANSNNTVLTGTATVANVDAQSVETDALSINSTAVTATAAELNTLDGITSTTAELNKLDGFTGDVNDLNYAKDLRASGVTAAEFDKIDGLTATSSELNILDGATVTTTELNTLDGITATTAELNITDGLTATTSELNILDGATLSTTELNLLDGVTATTTELNILDGVTSTTAELNKLDGFTGTVDDLNYAKDLRATGVTTTEFDKLDGLTATTAELNYTDGVTSNIQTQLNAKADLSGASFTGDVDVTGTVSADSLTVNGGASGTNVDVFSITNDGSTSFLRVQASDLSSTACDWTIRSGASESIILAPASDKAMELHSNGDCLWYEDTGSTAKLTWDASDESLEFGDSVKAKFGASDDLQIYHDGGNSFIKDTGDGILFVQGSGGVRVLGSDTSESLARFNENGSVQLYHDNAEKLATTSTGVDVTGTVTADGLTVDGDVEVLSGTLLRTTNAGVTNPSLAPNLLRFEDNDPTKINNQVTGAIDWYSNDNDGTGVGAYINGYTNNTGGGYLTFGTGVAGTPLPRLTLSVNGDFHLYEDTGTTAKFVWDSSAESLGIGTSSPSAPLHVKGGSISTPATASAFISNATSRLVVNHANEYGVYVGYANSSNDAIGVQSARSNGVTSPLLLNPYGGNVGIGTSSPATTTDIRTSNGSDAKLRIGSSSHISLGTVGTLEFYSADPDNAGVKSFIRNEITGNVGPGGSQRGNIVFGTATSGDSASERARIDSSGNLLVGQSGFSINSDGVGLGTSGQYSHFTRTNNYPVLINRRGNDGALVSLRKDGSTVGSIGAKSNDLTIGTGNTGFKFVDAYNMIQPVDSSTGSDRDAAISLGFSNQRFKDLYLSGGVYLGGTGSANKLDDYEEGTWTPTNAGDATGVVDGGTGHYIKVGQMVTLIFGLDVTTGFTSNKIGGLPFPQAHSGMGSTWGSTALVANDNDDIVSCSLQSTVTGIQFHNNGNIGNQHQLGTGGNNRYYRGYITYRTNA